MDNGTEQQGNDASKTCVPSSASVELLENFCLDNHVYAAPFPIMIDSCVAFHIHVYNRSTPQYKFFSGSTNILLYTGESFYSL